MVIEFRKDNLNQQPHSEERKMQVPCIYAAKQYLNDDFINPHHHPKTFCFLKCLAAKILINGRFVSILVFNSACGRQFFSPPVKEFGPTQTHKAVKQTLKTTYFQNYWSI